MPERSAILIVDDDENSIILLESAFEAAKVSKLLKVTTTGGEAMDYLSGKGVYADRRKYPWPALMLLDLNMPAIDGFDLLAWWRTYPQRKNLPIVVMSSSDVKSDVEKAIALGAAAYYVKPVDFYGLVKIARELGDRWLNPGNSV